MKRAIIIGATSGIGREVARLLAEAGWRIGICGRREALLHSLQADFPNGQVETTVMDVTSDNAPLLVRQLIDRLGGMDLFFLSSGIGSQNAGLDPEIELRTARTNCEGFMRMTTFAFNYFREHLSAHPEKRGHIAVISSVAGTKGIGLAPAYSATKRFQNTYIDALEQLAHLHHLPIDFTDIRPGFVATDLLRDANYPLLMQVPPVAKSIVRALSKKQRICIIDARYSLLVFCWRLIPRWIWKRLPLKRSSAAKA